LAARLPGENLLTAAAAAAAPAPRRKHAQKATKVTTGDEESKYNPAYINHCMHHKNTELHR
jgi:hypothetical protein